MRVGVVHDLRVPGRLQDYLTRIGGVNLFGEPRFRLVWSESRLDWKGRPKYHRKEQRERFVVEVFREPTWEGYGTRENWDTSAVQYRSDGLPMRIRGPFPSRGDYEFLDTVESVDAAGNRNYLMPTEAYLDTVVNLFNLLVANPVKDQDLEERDRTKREADYQYILERVKEKTDPCFRPAFAAINNTTALSGDVDKIASSVEALTS